METIFEYYYQNTQFNLKHIKKKKQYQLTKSGSENYLNGIFGWVYEEEFSSYDSYKWSPDSKKIVFCEEDQSEVPIYTMIDELKLYPKLKTIKYPISKLFKYSHDNQLFLFLTHTLSLDTTHKRN